MVPDLNIHLFKLDGMLEGFTIEIKDFKFKTMNVQSLQSESNVGSSASVVVFRDGEEITIRNPFGPATTKGAQKC